MIQFDKPSTTPDVNDDIAFAQSLTKFRVQGSMNYSEMFQLEGYGLSVEVTATASVPFDIFVLAVDEDNARKLVETAQRDELKKWIDWESAEFDVESPSEAMVDDEWDLRDEMKHSSDFVDVDVDEVDEA